MIEQIALISLVALGAAPPADVAEEAPCAWSSVSSGLQLCLRWDADQGGVPFGQRPRFTARLRNGGEQEARIFHGQAGVHRWGLQLRAGREFLHCVAPIPVDHDFGTVRVPPGQERSLTFTCEQWRGTAGASFGALPAGEYRAQLSYGHSGKESFLTAEDKKRVHWVGEVTAPEVELTVRPAEKARPWPRSSRLSKKSVAGRCAVEMEQAHLFLRSVRQGIRAREGQPPPVAMTIVTSVKIANRTAQARRIIGWELSLRDRLGRDLPLGALIAHVTSSGSEREWYGDLGAGETVTVRFQPALGSGRPDLKVGKKYRLVLQLTHADMSRQWVQSEPIKLGFVEPRRDLPPVP